MWKYLAPILAFAALAILLASGIGKDTRKIPSPLIDKPAPAFALPQLDQPDFTISRDDLLGKPYLLNVWASWCVACREEHEALSGYARRNEIAVIGLNWKDDPNDAKRWLDQFGDPYTLILTDFEGKTAIDFGVYGAPETFLIDASGVIRHKHIGPLTDGIIEQDLRPRIQKLLVAARDKKP